tara:strand:+ start:444 stop:767 length:324 start_codon:yes stop_codon:yes gene_type:complete
MEPTFYIAKLLLALVGVYLIYSSSTKEAKPWHFSTGCTLMGFVLFVTGVEFMFPVENAWTYWIFEAAKEDYSKALLGGSMMVFLPIILMAVCGKDIVKLIDSSNSGS